LIALSGPRVSATNGGEKLSPLGKDEKGDADAEEWM